MVVADCLTPAEWARAPLYLWHAIEVVHLRLEEELTVDLDMYDGAVVRGLLVDERAILDKVKLVVRGKRTAKHGS